MLPVRYVQQSTYTAVKNLFLTPVAPLITTTPYSVYNEDAFFYQNYQTTFPYVWLLDVRVPPDPTKLPMILMELEHAQRHYYEVGTRKGTDFRFHLHIFGRNRGERDDLASYLYQNLQTISLSDYTVSPPTFLYTVSVEESVIQQNSIAPEQGKEGALLNWDTFSFVIWTRE